MSSPIGYSLGALTTNGVIRSENGLITYAEAGAGAVSLYEGSTSGKLLSTIPSSSHRAFTSAVQYGSTGLYITIASGTAVVHTA